MKLAPLFVFAGTVAGLAGILSFHTSPPASGLGASAASAGNAAAGSKSPSPGGSGHSHGRTSQHSSGSSGSGIATGSTVQYGYGQMAVKVTVHGGRIVDVAVASIQTAEPYSQQLASQAIPTLRSEVLSAQSAHIQGVSGATYTSEAYAQSLQSALSKLHVA